MKRLVSSRYRVLVFVVMWMVSACSPQQSLVPTPPVLPLDTPGQLPATVTVYHSNPSHLWNRVFAHFYARIAPDSTVYGEDALEPLLWHESTHLLNGSAHQQALALLDEFLAQDAGVWLDDPLKRALMQRDLWAVFDWSTLADTLPEERQALQVRLAAAIEKLALSRAEIEALPDNYQAAVDSGAFPAHFDSNSPHAAFLPPDLFAANGEWVNLGREDGPMAMWHVSRYPVLGRSAFHIYARLPGGLEATRDFVQILRAIEQPGDAAPPPYMTEFALVKQMILIDDQGEMVISPLTETIQIQRRHSQSTTDWVSYKFEIARHRLFSGEFGGLRSLTSDDLEVPLFNAHSLEWFFKGELRDVPTSNFPAYPVLERCSDCHTYGMRSIISISRHGFDLLDSAHVVVRETAPEREAEFVIAWKEAHESWSRLNALFTAASHTPEPAHTDEIAVGVSELDALLALLQRNELSIEHVQFTSLPCTHRIGLGGPPKCAEGEAEGAPIDVLPIMAQSGSYLRRSQTEDTFLTTAASVEVVYRVIEDGPGEGWPRGEYGVIVHETNAFPPVTTFFVTNGKIVRITAHMGKSLDAVRAEVTGEILYHADALSP